MRIRALSWNLFHGRAANLRAGRDLFDEFAAALDRWQWDLCLLQECPPRWADGLASATGARLSQQVLTSRNWLQPLRSAIATRHPDLLGSWEGGSNLTLVRGPLAGAGVDASRELLLRRLPERRRMGFLRLGSGLCVANLHASRTTLAGDDVGLAAERAVEWAGDTPLIFGGDLNLASGQTNLFEDLEDRLGLSAPAPFPAVDHLLARGLKTTGPPRSRPLHERQLESRGQHLLLSDHAPVAAIFTIPENPHPSPP